MERRKIDVLPACLLFTLLEMFQKRGSISLLCS